MKLYLDDDSIAALLVRLLRAAGHDVQVPADVGRSGAADPVHLTVTIQTARAFLTHNHWDFELLHELVIASGGHHPGILVVRKDNDTKRDLTMPGIVRAIANLIGAGVPIADQYTVLNHWR